MPTRPSVETSVLIAFAAGFDSAKVIFRTDLMSLYLSFLRCSWVAVSKISSRIISSRTVAMLSSLKSKLCVSKIEGTNSLIWASECSLIGFFDIKFLISRLRLVPPVEYSMLFALYMALMITLSSLSLALYLELTKVTCAIPRFIPETAWKKCLYFSSLDPEPSTKLFVSRRSLGHVCVSDLPSKSPVLF